MPRGNEDGFIEAWNRPKTLLSCFNGVASTVR
jgi:hypothetical protein